jgi:hypothetical protein
MNTLGYAARAKNIRNQPSVQLDPAQAALSALKREVRLLRTENGYLREQLFQANLPRGQLAPPAAAMLPTSLTVSRLPSSHGRLPGTPGSGQLLLPPGSLHVLDGDAAAAGVGSSGGSRPGSGGGGGAEPAPGPAPNPEGLMRRLLETQRMLVQFSKENDRLAGENGRLRNGRTLVANDYKGE